MKFLVVALVLGCGSAASPSSSSENSSGASRAETETETETNADPEPDADAEPEAVSETEAVSDTATGSEPESLAVHVPADVSQPLSDDARSALAGLPTERITPPNEFYYRSNERRHDLVAPALANLGGATIGVGSDQLYTLAAMSNASLIVGVDYDNRIPMIHAIYQVLVPVSESPQDLIAHFDESNERATIARLEAELPEGEKVKTLRIFRRIRAQMHTYLGRVARRIREARPASWLADNGLYAHVRALFVGGRVVARTGDVTGTTTLRSVGSTLQRLGVPIGVLYFSNAEQFFEYTEDFNANIAALPVTERTLVVRTIRHTDIANAEDDRWHYVLQDFADFKGRLETGAYRRSTLLLEDLVLAGEAHIGPGISRLNESVPRAVWQRRQARAARRAEQR